MIKQRNCKQCSKLFSSKRLNNVYCSFNCIKLSRKIQAINKSDKKIRMPNFNYHFDWNEFDKLL